MRNFSTNDVKTLIELLKAECPKLEEFSRELLDCVTNSAVGKERAEYLRHAIGGYKPPFGFELRTLDVDSLNAPANEQFEDRIIGHKDGKGVVEFLLVKDVSRSARVLREQLKGQVALQRNIGVLNEGVQKHIETLEHRITLPDGFPIVMETCTLQEDEIRFFNQILKVEYEPELRKIMDRIWALNEEYFSMLQDLDGTTIDDA